MRMRVSWGEVKADAPFVSMTFTKPETSNQKLQTRNFKPETSN